MRNALTAVGLAAMLAFGASTAPLRAAGEEPSQEAIDNALLTTVKVWMLNTSGKVMGGCSGTVIDARGYILTNFHCVGTPEGNYSNAEGTPGELYRKDGAVMIGLTLNPRKAPKPTYIAQAVAGNAKLDVAVLKITGMVEKGAKLPDPLPLVVMQRADSEAVKLGNYIGVLGYPGLGGDLVNYSSGKVSGFEDFDGNGELDAFKTDATVAGGNSGGLAINAEGLQIGIPSYGQGKDGNAIGRVRMINLAEPYIQKALQLGGVGNGSNNGNKGRATPTPAPRTTVTPGARATPTPPRAATPAPASKSGFSNLRFGTDIVDDQLAGEATSLPSGTTRIAASVDVRGLREGDSYGNAWYADGQNIVDQRDSGTWTEDGTTSLSSVIYNTDGSPVPDGLYRLEFWLNGKVAISGEIQVGEAGKVVTPVPPKQGASTVTLKGEIIDVDTQEGIPDAYVVVLKPGVSFDEVENAGEDEARALIAAVGRTDDSGAFITAPGLERGKTYSVWVFADGYEDRRFPDALTIKSSGQNVLRLDPIEMQVQ
ncbi:MAG: trypsin-like peptidase domain-containing protein [Thermoflexales bacterium]|nr:trypsin-like peptidase domain-containing protein [Thermoflexales bacterium]